MQGVHSAFSSGVPAHTDPVSQAAAHRRDATES
jgi:hypothetical protein